MAMQPTESVNTALGGVSPPSVITPSEMGTAQQENPGHSSKQLLLKCIEEALLVRRKRFRELTK
jgi:hypothetical protein